MIRLIHSAIASMALATAFAHAKYGEIVDPDGSSSGGYGIVLFVFLCVAGYILYQREEKARADRIAAREREDELRAQLREKEHQDFKPGA